ncbi:putative phage abortive infection protein [bacterium]|nr:putative phage abortive infection protein [bacterium]
MKNENIELNIKRSKILVAILISGTLLSYSGWFYFTNNYSLALDSSVWGTFGDFFGGVLNPLIASIAFYWITVSVWTQKTELEETKKALVDQSVTQEKMRFEDTFFSLLEQHNKILEQLNVTEIINNRVSKSYVEKMTRAIIDSSLPVIDAKSKLHEEFNSSCGHYFRVLYQLLKLIAVNYKDNLISPKFSCDEINNSPITDGEKFYSNIVRSFISFDMAKLLAVNCVCESQDDTYYRYRLLIERYNFLEHMPIDNQIMEGATENYDESVFGESEFFAEYKARRV